MSSRARAFFAGLGVDGVARVAVFWIPFAFAATRCPLESQWRDDLPMARAFDLAVGDPRGALSTALMQVAALLPLGNRTFRGALVAAAALGGCALLIYEIARRVLSSNTPAPRLSSALACFAALSATLALPFQVEGTVAGGATVACLAPLAAVLWGPAFASYACASSALDASSAASPANASTSPRAASDRAGGFAFDGRDRALTGGAALVLGALAGGALFENEWAAVAVVLVALLQGILVRANVRPRTRESLTAGTGSGLGRFGLGVAMALATAAVVGAPELVGRFRGGPFMPMPAGGLPSWGSLAGGLVPSAPGLDRWIDQVGGSALALAVVGMAVGLTRSRSRAQVAPLLALVLLDLLAAHGGRPRAAWEVDPRAALRLADVAALSVVAALGVQSVVAAVLASSLSFARPAAILIVAFDLTIVTTAAEQAAPLADRSDVHAAAAWTDEALESLPARSAVLARSPAVIARLLGETASEQGRPDLLVVPVPLLGRGNLAAHLLYAEPRVRGLLTESSLGGSSENALSALAAVRPLFVELDAGWERRTLSHLVAAHLWHRFAYEPRGPSDRREGWAGYSAAVHAVLAASTVDGRRDPATLSVLVHETREQLEVAAALGDREQARALAVLYAEVSPDDALLAEVEQRLESSKRGGVDLGPLFR